jgi:chromosome segregation ATPase
LTLENLPIAITKMSDTQENNQPAEDDKPKKSPLDAIQNIFASREAREAQAEVDALQSQLAEAAEEFDIMKSDLADKQVELEAALAENEAMKAEVAALKEEILAAQESAGRQAAQIALESHADPADLAPSAPSDAEIVPANEEELEAELAKIDSHSEKSALIKRFKASKN